MQLLRLFIISSIFTVFVGCGEVEEFFEDLETLGEDAIDVVDPTDSPNTTITTTIVPTTTIEPTNPTCHGTFFPPDGLGGFVWKPESESNGNLVVLLPGNFQKKFNSCIVYDGVSADSLKFDKFDNYDGKFTKPNFRQHWRGDKSGHQYNAPALVVCNDGSQDCAWEVARPWERVD